MSLSTIQTTSKKLHEEIKNENENLFNSRHFEPIKEDRHQEEEEEEENLFSILSQHEYIHKSLSSNNFASSVTSTQNLSFASKNFSMKENIEVNIDQSKNESISFQQIIVTTETMSLPSNFKLNHNGLDNSQCEGTDCDLLIVHIRNTNKIEMNNTILWLRKSLKEK